MSGWRDHILAYFAPQTSRLTLVADPDGLLVEEGIQPLGPVILYELAITAPRRPGTISAHAVILGAPAGTVPSGRRLTGALEAARSESRF